MSPGSEGALVLVLSGPNLNLLGTREPDVYGTETLEDHVAAATDEADSLGLKVEHHQSNHEGDLVDVIHEARGRAAALVVNAGALTHYSWAIHDALAAFKSYDGSEGDKSQNGLPVVVEVHLSNPQAREPWRGVSVVAPVADGSVSGFGGLGYRLAIQAVARLLSARGASA